MKRAIALALWLSFVAGCSGDAAPAYAMLFDPQDARLGAAEKQAIFDAMADAFPVSGDGSTLIDPNCGDIEPKTVVTDLNGDGTSEVFIEWGNTCLSGHTGRSLTLFVRDASGNYRNQLGFPASGYEPLERGVDGFPDLQLGGPGFCFPVWAWDGLNYQFQCNLPQEAGGCESRENICREEN